MGINGQENGNYYTILGLCRDSGGRKCALSLRGKSALSQVSIDLRAAVQLASFVKRATLNSKPWVLPPPSNSLY